MLKNLFIDIFYSVTHQKLRTFLTGFGVAWGIFILVLLLGASGGLEKGILQLLNGFAQNSMWVYGGYSTAEQANNKYSKAIVFTPDVLAQLKNNYPDAIEYISPDVQVAERIVYREKMVNAQIHAVLPAYFQIKTLKTTEGRLLTPEDDRQSAQVAVIGAQVKSQVFGNKPAIGQELQIGNSFFRVVGILKGGTIFSQADQNSVFVPFHSATSCLTIKNEFSIFGFTLRKNCISLKAENHIKHYLGRVLGFDPNDTNALYVFNFDQQVKSFQKLFTGLNIFLWFIGICLLLSGMVGVSNIMFVIVNERTREIGIRKAVGAKRKHILVMVLTESATITVMAGLVGVFLGTGILSLIEYGLQKLVDDDFLIRETSINWGTVAGALFVLVISGLVAGFIPAQRAAEIQPIEAMRSE